MNDFPTFEKKEPAYASAPYAYVPSDIVVYSIEVQHKDAIDGELLQQALDKTIERMPYLSDTLIEDHGAVYFATNSLPMKAANFAGIRRVGGKQTNYHMLDLTWDGNTTWFSMAHVFCDGQGINAFMESVLYNYYCLKDGVDYDPCGIRCDKNTLTDAETIDPLAHSYEVAPGFEMPNPADKPTPFHLPELSMKRDSEIYSYGFNLPSNEFMTFVRANGATPAVVLSMLIGEAIARVNPDADAPIVANLPVSMRKMLGCEETFMNCSSRAMLPVVGTPMDAMPFAQRAATLRGLLKKQLDPNLIRTVANYMGATYRTRMDNATNYVEEINKPSNLKNMSHDTFYVDYIGSLRPVAYADQITSVRFLCYPALGMTMHTNIIEHAGYFRIDCLVCEDMTAYVDALEAVFAEHGVAAEREVEYRFDLPRCAWQKDLILGKAQTSE